MALTKVTGQVIKNTTDVTVGVLTVTNTLAVGGTVSIGGTLTYEDVTNVDAVGLITARNGIVVGSGITLSKDGDVFFTGIATGNGSGLTALNASNLASGTVPTARLGSGTASSSTFLRGDSTFQTVNTDLVSDTSPQLGGDLQSNGNNIDFAEVDKLRFGTDQDLRIWHQTNSNILGSSGVMYLHNTGASATDLDIRAQNDILLKPQNGEQGIKIIGDGAVELYHDNNKIFETIAAGFKVGRTSSSNSYIEIVTSGGTSGFLYGASNNEMQVMDREGHAFLKGIKDGAVELYYDNSKKIETTNTGTVTTGIATATEFVPTVGQLSHRNLIINGEMQVCQRYALASMNNISGSTHTYHTDRFKGYNGNGGILGLEWQENYPEGHHYSLRIKCVTADTSVDGLTFVSHVIEDKNIQHLNYGLSYAKSCTLSFWIKSNMTGTFSVGLINDTQGSRGFVAEYTISASNTWEKKIITVPGDTAGTWNAGGLRVHWALAIQSDRRTSTLNTWHNTSSVQYCSTNQPNFMSSTNNYMNLTGVQFEVGSATPYEHISYGDELARCQRYYQDISPRSTGWIVSATQVRFSVDWVTQMRANPTCTLGGAFVQYGPGGQQTGTLQGFGDISVNGCIPILNTGGGMTTNAPATGGISMTADAEL